MSFYQFFEFLRDLNQPDHNNKEWMDEHRSEYKATRDFFIAWLNDMDARLAQADPDYFTTPGKKAISRINNNRMFHPDRPVYKDNMSASLDRRKNYPDFYLHFGLNGSFIGGGFYHPPKEQLDKIRAAIDYDGERLREITQAPDFKQYFGGLIEDDMLKTSPRDYPGDHPHIDLLRYKNFAAMNTVTQKEIMSDDIQDHIVAVYMAMKPLRNYLAKAVSI